MDVLGPCIFSLNIGLCILPSNSFLSCLDSLLGYAAGELQALQLIVLVVLMPRINHLPPVYAGPIFGNLV